MTTITRVLILAGLLCNGAATLADDAFPGIKKLMPEEAFNRAGLDKLSDNELEQLDRWLIGYTATEAPVQRKTSAAVRQVERDTIITSTIEGAFSGWSGKTQFTLSNGQVWRQRLAGKWRYRAESPKVTIEKNIMGFFVMRVDDKKSVGVKRVR